MKATENGAPPGDALDFLDTISVEELEYLDANGPPTPLLDTINYPMHMKNLSTAQLRQLCKEIRSDLIHTVSQTGGHLGSSLGVVELTVAMHHVFNCPADKFIFDVGHQAYVHKMLTGRRKKMGTIRQSGGLSGTPQAHLYKPLTHTLCSSSIILVPLHAAYISFCSQGSPSARRVSMTRSEQATPLLLCPPVSEWQ